MRIRTMAAAAALVLATGGLAACGSSSSGSAGTSPGATTGATAVLTVTDPWVKAADSGMTAAFGVLSNPGTADVTVMSATTSASGMTELHETVMKDGTMQMQPKAGGFVVPAGGSLTLEPGGNHIMIMGLKTPVKPGEDVKVTLTLSDGSTVPFTAVAKDYSGGNESYQPSPSMSMSMG